MIDFRLGDCLDVLKTLADESVHCCVTSPPYFGLRDYGTARWQGGDIGCDHLMPPKYGYDSKGTSTLGPKGTGLPETNAAYADGVKRQQYRGCCEKCGAVRIDSQIGIEKTPDEYLKNMVEVFREVKRVLRADGTCWINIGDSYTRADGTDKNISKNTKIGSTQNTLLQISNRKQSIPIGLKNKDMIGIPWMLAFALRADGWYLRQDIIWAKPNPMPESVTDRCTKSHEYIFMLSKSEKYYFDNEAIKEPVALSTIARLPQPNLEHQAGSNRVPGKTNGPMKAVGSVRSKRDSFKRENSKRTEVIPGQSVGTHRNDREQSAWDIDKRNKRDVWTVATRPFKEAHFAVFPPTLIEPCVLAGCPVGGTVLDPFSGAGTTGLLCDRLNRSAILIELNPEYLAMSQQRIWGDLT